jgi:hypothetical protein
LTLAKYPVTEDTGQIFKPEGNNNRNRVSHDLIKQYFAEYEIAQGMQFTIMKNLIKL